MIILTWLKHLNTSRTSFLGFIVLCCVFCCRILAAQLEQSLCMTKRLCRPNLEFDTYALVHRDSLHANHRHFSINTTLSLSCFAHFDLAFWHILNVAHAWELYVTIKKVSVNVHFKPQSHCLHPQGMVCWSLTLNWSKSCDDQSGWVCLQCNVLIKKVTNKE